jgi:uncharacterized protein (TIGR04255 family)
VSQITYKVLKHDGGWAYEANGTYSEPFPTQEAETFETLRNDFLAGLAAVEAALKLEYVDQVSMRYLDAVVPPNGEAGLSEYLVPQVMGLTPHITDRVTIQRAECLIQFQTEQRIEVIARTRIQSGPVALPPDLQPISIKVADRFGCRT